ncbi:phage terminase small subunit P27 family [Pseudomonas sp. FFUP_PS_473]|uniref:phage terminase small subunit P27 family n=1 Tax=Pseudomonas sp. FFUP_PS_473 TaxID=2060418 RepID=UPI000C7BC3C4|nr:phage terminase small subunit P27 family [Pseudomonas sp. FFUP_PS_473]PLP87625.1 phage terminase small subunit P27 family [Pseudomonas sp. FFUP_PS_473]
MAGRRPTPTELKLVRGNPGKRPINKKEPLPAKRIPSTPAHLTDEGQVAWGRLTVLLDRMGVLTEADGFALERLCDCYSEILALRELVDANGRTYETTSTQGELVIKANPAVAMLADADRRFKSYLVEFGLTPAARSKVQIKTDDDQEDQFAEFFG